MAKSHKSSLQYILEGLVPYTEANLLLTFKPSSFFNELEKIDIRKRAKASYKSTYYRAIRNGYFTIDTTGRPSLTPKGVKKLKIYKPTKLGNDARVMLVFDIPEVIKFKRERLRATLRELKYIQIQKSVWISEYESWEILKEELDMLDIAQYVDMFEVVKYRPSSAKKSAIA
jgi:phage antirepressor YoqD-like protein